MAEDVQVGDSGDSSSMRTNNPFVFISHDTRDAELAEAFSNLLKSVSAGVLKSFRTSDRRGNQGIEYGVEWYPEIIKSIQAASDVVCLLTERSVDRPWILFEAGMAKGKLDTPILGVALGIELKAASSGPFAQFQNCADDEESLTKLVFQLVNRIPGSEPDRDTIRFQVGKFKAAVDEIIGKLALPASQEKKKAATDDENSSAKLFEEIKIMFQDLPTRMPVREVERYNRPERILPLSEAVELMYRRGDFSLGVRVALGVYRNHLPWVYDEGCALIKKLGASNSLPYKKKSLIAFEDLLISSVRNPYFEMKFKGDKEEFYLAAKELPSMLMHGFHEIGRF
ncbi:toll/interleukin-1 receptor domain-containing protein [Stenotrophomonas maltophilia]|uniref:toll/interleukin-1 receptor domain-containing protein n=5 Tax=Stenotrophomonas maltophilia TaxID=40324 RepID=UPI00066DB233|nr:toll/interleukin-1 receptor domain-containing protein [Stenotrophomonas maltophilia]